jgi:hypothetical protein
MARTADASGDGTWPLASGTWRPARAPGGGYTLVSTALGHAPADELSVADLRALFQPAGDGPLYPPEFRFSPVDGSALAAPAPAAGWIALHGAAALTPDPPVQVRGLWRCEQALQFSGWRRRAAHDEPDLRMELPPPGHWEFFSLRAATAAPALLALDPDQGMLFARLPHSGRWEALAPPQGQLLAPSGLARAAWRCEVSEGAPGCRLLLPTQSGLARLTPDVPALSFELDQVADAPALGGPIQLGHSVWLPLRQGDAAVALAGMDAQGTLQRLEVAGLAPAELRGLQAPVATARWAVWPCEAGQLRLRREAGDRFQVDFVHWPAELRPVFDFGCPYQAQTGSLWQLCFNDSQGQYVYLQLGEPHGERAATATPRACSGRASFRSTQRDQVSPWEEPEHGDDSRGHEVMLPLLETRDGQSVIGLRLPAPAGLRDLFERPQRLAADLVLDDRQGEAHAFHKLPRVLEPWRTRLFVHDGVLWAYHPLRDHIDGWRLQR